ncbi:MAG: ABC transporter substrate-binding protein [Bacillota bacterium]
MKKIVSLMLILFVLMTLSAGAAAEELTVMHSEPPLTMDPSNHSAGYTMAVLYPMYETLTMFNDDMEVVPSLATYWETSEDGTEWTYQIREGVKFHDGSELNAEVVKASFDRLLNPDNGLSTRSRFAGVVESVEVINDYTVRFNLGKPYPAFHHLTSMHSGAIMSPKAMEKGNEFLARNVVGTGPYKFVEWVSGERVVMEKNENYWKDNSDSVEKMIFKWSSEKSVRVMALQSGEVDVIFPVPPAYAKVIENAPNLKLYEEPSDKTLWLALNTLHEPLDNVKVRQALNYATDREAMIKSLLFGHGTVANSPMGPVSFGYDPETPAYEYDLEKAKELLKEAGYEDGFTLPIAVQEAEANIAEALQGMWSDIGVEVEVNRMEYGLWADEVFSAPENNKGYSVIASWAASLLDADGFLTPLFHTDSFAPAGANLGFYSNEKVDSLLDEAARTVDPDKRLELYSEAQRIIQDEGAHVSLYYANSLAGMNEKVKNVWMMSDMLVFRNPVIAE